MIRGTICFVLIATLGTLMACEEPLYVGNDPSKLIRLGGRDPSVPPSEEPTSPDGSCLLEYNSALVDSGADACCYYQGQQNSCNTAAQCNEISGGYCCLIYGTENTVGGGRCCLYEGGQFGDGATECKDLLSNAPAGGPVIPLPSDSCLLSYNTALILPDADACCYYEGQQNRCNPMSQCNELSGGSCCLIYGTENTEGGARCCLYEGGRLGDDAEECKTLLSGAT